MPSQNGTWLATPVAPTPCHSRHNSAVPSFTCWLQHTDTLLVCWIKNLGAGVSVLAATTDNRFEFLDGEFNFSFVDIVLVPFLWSNSSPVATFDRLSSAQLRALRLHRYQHVNPSHCWHRCSSQGQLSELVSYGDQERNYDHRVPGVCLEKLTLFQHRPTFSARQHFVSTHHLYLSASAVRCLCRNCLHHQTTRTGTKGQPFGNALNYGAGHVDPSAAMDPALVFDSNYTDWQRFLCAVEPVDGDDCATL